MKDSVPSRRRAAGRMVGSRLGGTALAAITVAAVMAVLSIIAFFTLGRDTAPRHLVIATGPESGTYHELGLALADVLEAEGVAQTVEVQPTEGSVANMELVGGAGRRADLAFVQSDTPPSAGVRLVAPLYQEVLHVLVARWSAGKIVSIDDLQGRRVSLGGKGSGTRQVAARILRHFRVAVAEDLALSPEEVEAGFRDGSVDAAFVLTAIPSRQIEELCRRDLVRFMSLGDAQERGNEADALALVFPSFRSTVIPRSTYGQLPERPVATVEVSALLVASSELDSELVTAITANLFAHRSGLFGAGGKRLSVVRKIRERYQPGAVVLPYHDGAVTYYTRSEPSFIVEYSETLSLALTVFVGLISAAVAFREWMRRRMKNRIDVYYLEVEKLTTNQQTLSLEELIAHRDALHGLQRRAFSELVAERLEANESFTIFQDYLRSEWAAIDAQIAELKAR